MEANLDKPYRSASRRSFVKGLGAASAAAALAGPASLIGATSSNPTKAGKPPAAKNLIFLVVDGMGPGTLALAHHWSLRKRQAPLEWMRLYQRPKLAVASQFTASASSPVTDSAAAASAWGCGQRLDNGTINIDAEGRSYTPLLVEAKEAGKRVGLVTSCRVTHATPAGFAANTPSRDNEDTIAIQYLDRRIDVILGGGSRHFERLGPGSDQLERNLIPSFRDAGYAIARAKSELEQAAGNPRLLGLFAESHIPYAIDLENDPAHQDIPNLDQQFRAALASLRQAPEGFVLQVEGGRVDHVGHANDPAGILREQLDFDRCIATALEFVDQSPDTLLVVTTDHGTGGCQLNGWGPSYRDSGPALDRIDRFTSSFEGLEFAFRKTGVFDPEAFQAATGFTPSPEQSEAIQKAIDDNVRYLSSVMTGLFAQELLEATAVGWTSNNHTGECVEYLALGPGARETPRFLELRDVNGLLKHALQLV